MRVETTMRKKASIIGAEKGEKEGQIWMEGERRQSVEKWWLLGGSGVRA